MGDRGGERILAFQRFDFCSQVRNVPALRHQLPVGVDRDVVRSPVSLGGLILGSGQFSPERIPLDRERIVVTHQALNIFQRALKLEGESSEFVLVHPELMPAGFERGLDPTKLAMHSSAPLVAVGRGGECIRVVSGKRCRMCGLALITRIRPGISRRRRPEGRAVVVVHWCRWPELITA